jgi:steroid 5-alpha reductase family enzyme
MTEGIAVGPARPLSRGASFAAVVLAYAVAAAAAVAVGAAMGDDRPLLTVLVADLAATLVVFVASRAVNNSSMYDAYWSVAPPIIVLYLAAVAEPGVDGLRQALVIALVWAWAVRLTANWARSWPGLDHEDWRYVAVRANGRPYWVQSFFGLHLFPTLQVYLGCLALYPAVSVGTDGFGALDVVAVIVTGGAILVELVADEQLRSFNRTKAPGDICRRGLWSWSRHPNYFGELSFWWGLWLFGLAADPTWWWTVIGPVGMTAMFLFASIPMIDRRGLERRPGYEDHMRRTSMILLRPPRSP